jgi:redox-sensitive bicupin YhaK (pirin superfamily)
MRQIRRAAQRGHADHGWLDTWHTFSFADYYDPEQMGFRDLRVINEDRVAGGTGFGAHPHREMEILTYVLKGRLRHGDSMGHTEILSAGEWQRLSAGTGLRHSEHNADAREPVHLYQIWITPRQRGLPPTYEQRRYDGAGKVLVASPDGRDGSLTIRQDARVYLARLSPGETIHHPLSDGRHAWLQVVQGPVHVGEDVLETSDGLAVSGEPELTMRAEGEAEVILFDLP